MIRELFKPVVGLALFLAVAAGCGGGTSQVYTDDSRDAEKYATNVKQVVVTQVSDARTSREPADDLSVITSILRNDGPRGNYGDVYDRLLAIVEPLEEACEQADGPTGDLPQKLDELLAIADELPGEVEPLK